MNVIVHVHSHVTHMKKNPVMVGPLIIMTELATPFHTLECTVNCAYLRDWVCVNCAQSLYNIVLCVIFCFYRRLLWI